MKRLLCIFSIILVLVVLPSCENKNIVRLKEQIATANATCPINMGIGGDLLSIKYQEKENRVIIYYSVNEQLGGALFISKNKDKLLQQFRLIFSRSESQQILKDIINAKASLMMIFKAPSSGKTVKFELPYEELNDIRVHPLSDSEIQRLTIENKVEIENARCPYRIEEGISLTKVALVNDNMVLYCEIDESLFDMSDLKHQIDIVKENISEELLSNRKDVTMQNELRMFVDQNIGYHYRYYGDKSKEYIDVMFTPEELSRYIVQ